MFVENTYYLEKISDAWEKLAISGDIEESIRDNIKESWNRCINDDNNKLNPITDKPTDVIIRGNKLKEIKEQNSKLIYYCLPKMKELYSLVKGSGYNVILADNKGCILKVIGDKSLAFSKKYDIIEGANWSEEVQGTNAVGTLIKNKTPVTIFSKEHLLKKNHDLVCTAVPIIDKFGYICGVLCMAANYKNIHPHTSALLKKVCEDINRELIVQSKDYSSLNNSLKNKQKEETADYNFSDIIYKSLKMKELMKAAKKVAFNDSTVLIHGETGTGKELLAQSIHNYSFRSNKPFVAVNCSAIPDDLFESEFFGYEEGAFTGGKKGGRVGKLEYADEGTVFLDEINNLTKVNQARLLRVIEEQKITSLGSNKSKNIDLRFIAASNKSLAKLVEENKFRKDLYYRLNVVNLNIPPLKERKIDILVLANYFLRKLGYKFNKGSLKIGREAKQIFLDYNWPGNVRELRNVIESALNLMDNSILKLEHIPNHIRKILNDKGNRILTFDEYEKKFIRDALVFFDGNITLTAKQLNIARNTLYRKLEKYNISGC
ncbi:sigma-54 interaction domain-containing protein [Halanaerobium hydrogeniformans]|uniref:Sigma54 specific transcriptional regulator, Fis family n=1 Tax=Halanaerobium hydrogeniformans TaxID=656519 RepID=E4RMV5_HALHG|nr:sigma-54-dependent Fis family transcriptional regulator [Halanaerobium hydrogeniformans]ADQ14172.1 sigma54 specific transcriptional regulator, Fis family [Halanaerobium hydrogeniformans]